LSRGEEGKFLKESLTLSSHAGGEGTGEGFLKGVFSLL